MGTGTIHVTPERGGVWRVALEGEPSPLSEHTTATEAERAALEHARRGTAPVVVHDRYHRSHLLPAGRRPADTR